MPIRVNHLRDSVGRLIQRDVPTLPTGQTVADRTSPNQFLVAEREFALAGLSDAARVALSDGVTDVWLESLAGIRYQDTEMAASVNGGLAGWGGVDAAGLFPDGSGNLTLAD